MTKIREMEVKEALSIVGVRIIDIAAKFNCTPSNVHQLFYHPATKAGKPSLIRKYIAKLIGKDYQEVWG